MKKSFLFLMLLASFVLPGYGQVSISKSSLLPHTEEAPDGSRTYLLVVEAPGIPEGAEVVVELKGDGHSLPEVKPFAVQKIENELYVGGAVITGASLPLQISVDKAAYDRLKEIHVFVRTSGIPGNTLIYTK